MNTASAPLAASVSPGRAGIIGAMMATTVTGLAVMVAAIAAGAADQAVLGAALTLLAALGVGAAARPYAVSSVS
jgi:hypothetical protein